MRISGAFCALLAAVVRVAAKAVAHDAPPSDASSANLVHGSYIVELEASESLADFYHALSSEEGIKTEERMSMGSSKIFNGASFKVLGAAGHDPLKILDLIRAKPAVKAVWPVRTMTLDAGKPQDPKTPATPSPGSSQQKRQESPVEKDEDTFMPHLMTQIDRLHALNLTGKGFRIAMMDSGVDYTHPSLGGCFGPGCLVEGGWDFVGDAPAGGDPEPDADPFDGCFGHGTHVAGTIAAQPDSGNPYGFVGAAPGVKLWSYRCWNCAGVGSNEILVASFLRAFEDGADLIQCSNGLEDVAGWADEPWPGSPRASPRRGCPSSGLGVVSVAAVQNRNDPIFVSRGSYTTANDDDNGQQNNNKSAENVYGFFAGTPYLAQTLTLPLWAVGNDTGSVTDACSPLPDDTPDLSDKLVLLRVVPDARASNCYPPDQGQNIRAKGGRYMAYYAYSNTSWDEEFVYTEGLEAVISVAPHQGAAWLEMLGRGVQVNVTIPAKNATKEILVELEDHETGGFADAFTSWGPNWELEPKPQVASPGGRILSTYPVAMGSFRVMSGTSMASPLVAGIIALMGEARGGKLESDLFGRILSSTSKPLPWFDGKTKADILAPVQQVGSGLVQAYDAVFAKTILDVPSLRLNDTDHFVADHTFTVENTGAEEATYEIGHLKALSMYTMVSTLSGDVPSGFPNPTVDAWAELTFSPDVITVPAGGSAQVSVHVVPPQGVNATRLPVYSGYVSLNSTRGEHLVLPYLGVVGSMRSAPILRPGSAYLASHGSPVDANTTYDLPSPPDPAYEPTVDDEGRLPNMLISPVMGTRLLHVHLVALDETNSKNNTVKTPTGIPSLGPLAGWPVRYIAAVNQRAYFWGLLADGAVVPAGSYKMVASALRIFGDEAVVGDWDVVETVPFSIRYSNGTVPSR
ncbi:peptidase S8/S53 domain-containing protein [Apiospora marii]|uniref:peptidase S8/S53 domain-containing protein n=1 Tax=Apiospora marii TaxID=335849 RepID=UPI003131064B